MNFRSQRAQPASGAGWRVAGGAIIALLAAVAIAWAQGDVARDPSPKVSKERGPDNRRNMGPPHGGFGNPEDPLNGLGEEEKKRVREVLAKVWQDPAVMAAKENVRISTDEYREVLKNAVVRVDPEVAALMNKLHEQSRSAEMRQQFDHDMGKGGPQRPGMPMGPGRHVDGGELPEFFRALDDEKKKIFLDARNRAQESEGIVALRKEMEELEIREKDARDARFQLIMRLRRAMREEMIKIDPRVAEFAPDAPVPRSDRPQPQPPATDRPQRPKAE